MWRTSGLILLLCFVGIIMESGCEKKKQSRESWVVIGGDTITSTQAAVLDPLGTNDSVRLFHAAIWTLLGKKSPLAADDTLSSLFTERLSLVTGTEWTAKGALLILKAAQAIASYDDCSTVKVLGDSIAHVIQALNAEGFKFNSAPAWITCDTVDNDIKSIRIQLLQRVLGVTKETALLCYDFVFKKDAPLKSSTEQQVKAQISGLLASDSAAHTEAKKSVASSVSRPRKTAKQGTATGGASSVLEYRNEQSVRDTIARHIPVLRQLYKKSLKTDEAITGTVVITFEVLPDGAVKKAVVKSTQIRSTPFLNTLCGQLRTVRFKPIPARAGVMVFDFPFEFNAEM